MLTVVSSRLVANCEVIKAGWHDFRSWKRRGEKFPSSVRRHVLQQRRKDSSDSSIDSAITESSDLLGRNQAPEQSQTSRNTTELHLYAPLSGDATGQVGSVVQGVLIFGKVDSKFGLIAGLGWFHQNHVYGDRTSKVCERPWGVCGRRLCTEDKYLQGSSFWKASEIQLQTGSCVNMLELNWSRLLSAEVRCFLLLSSK